MRNHLRSITQEGAESRPSTHLRNDRLLLNCASISWDNVFTVPAPQRDKLLTDDRGRSDASPTVQYQVLRGLTFSFAQTSCCVAVSTTHFTACNVPSTVRVVSVLRPDRYAQPFSPYAWLVFCRRSVRQVTRQQSPLHCHFAHTAMQDKWSYLTSELAERFDMSSNKSGRLVKHLKTPAHGEYRLTTSPHSGKQVEMFVWSQRGVTQSRRCSMTTWSWRMTLWCHSRLNRGSALRIDKRKGRKRPFSLHVSQPHRVSGMIRL